MELTERALRRFVPNKRRVRRGNDVQILCDGEAAFPSMMTAVEQAKTSIMAEFYIWRGDRVGWQFADALIARSRAGVHVQAIYDAWGCVDVDPLIFDTMREEGIACIQYRPIAPWRPRWGFFRRNHRKMLIVDEQIGYVGGINLAQAYAPRASGGEDWKDFAVRVEGPVVNDMTRLFRHTWDRTRPQNEPTKKKTVVVPATSHQSNGNTSVALISNNEFGQRYLIRRNYIHAINQATHRIVIANAYFLPDRAIRRALYRARKRGVAVTVLVPGDSDVKLVKWATNHLYGRCLRRGIRIFEYQGSMLHAKTAVIDESWTTIGSYNLDHQSLRYNLEVNLTILDQEQGTAMANHLSVLLAQAIEITVENVRNRTWMQRLRYWLTFQIRKLL